MCLIICKPRGIEIPETMLKTAHQNNDDGWGVMVAHQGKIHVRKGFKYEKLRRAINKFEREFDPDNILIHLRMATHGKVDTDNCHPFKLGPNTMLMHNGVFSHIECNIDKNKSDTWHFCQKVVEVFPEIDELILDPEFSREFDYYTTGSRVVVLKNDGAIAFYNQEDWVQHKGLMLSNTYSIEPRQWRSSSNYAYVYGDEDWGYYDQKKNVWVDSLEAPLPPYISQTGKHMVWCNDNERYFETTEDIYKLSLAEYEDYMEERMYKELEEEEASEQEKQDALQELKEYYESQQSEEDREYHLFNDIHGDTKLSMSLELTAALIQSYEDDAKDGIGQGTNYTWLLQMARLHRRRSRQELGIELDENEEPKDKTMQAIWRNMIILEYIEHCGGPSEVPIVVRDIASYIWNFSMGATTSKEDEQQLIADESICPFDPSNYDAEENVLPIQTT